MIIKRAHPTTQSSFGGLRNNANFPDGRHRPDLSNRTLLVSAALIAVLAVVIIVLSPVRPGSPVGQSMAIIGSLLLCLPLVFSLMKRSGRSASPPLWFSVHVLGSSVGVLLICGHAANGDWLSPPGFVFFLLLSLIFQGFLSRALLGRRLSFLFARSAASFNFTQPLHIDREKLGKVIAAKQQLLKRLDADADEGLFSPTLAHWCRKPLLSWRYQQLITQESRLVGARQRAGWLLRAWRRVHIAAAVIFGLGMLAHIIVMLFFAGYAADGGVIDWWYFTDWGK